MVKAKIGAGARGALLKIAAGVGLLALTATQAAAVPSYARQTGLACEACHTVFPELTPFGRRFKLNGYIINNAKTISDETSQSRQNLAIGFFSPVSAMVVAGYTHTAKNQDDSNGAGKAQNGTVAFPEQLSLFYAGQVAPKLGTFIQLTYDPADGSIGMDNVDLRYADTSMMNGSKLTWGVTLNNNPTVQDLWNTVPAWFNPYMTSGSAPGPDAAPVIDNLGQGVAGVTAYAMLNDTWYGEAGLYTSAPQGVGGPYDTAAGMLLSGPAPYWRFAGEWDWGSNSFEVGTYGIAAQARVAGTCDVATQLTDGAGNPVNVFSHSDGVCQSLNKGPTDDYVDIALDTQYQYIEGNNIVTLAGTWIHENANLHSTARATNLADGTNIKSRSTTLNTVRGSLSYYYDREIGGSVQFFNSSGDANALVYGSANGKPDSNGVTLEMDYLPFLNTKLALAYTMYGKFNGATHNYDGAGANASDNDTLYAYLWLAF